MSDPVKSNPAAGEFAQKISQSRPGFLREMFQFLRHNGKWWLGPLIFILLVLGLLIVLGGTGLAPLIYTIF
jgi:hypothetical protein